MLRNALLLVAGGVLDDPQQVVHAGRAERPGQDVGAAPLQGRADLPLQRDVAVVDLDIDDRTVLPGTGPERGILFDLFGDDQLQLVVVKQAGFGPPDNLCSHDSPARKKASGFVPST